MHSTENYGEAMRKRKNLLLSINYCLLSKDFCFYRRLLRVFSGHYCCLWISLVLCRKITGQPQMSDVSEENLALQNYLGFIRPYLPHRWPRL